jgi:hypothetical protein
MKYLKQQFDPNEKIDAGYKFYVRKNNYNIVVVINISIQIFFRYKCPKSMGFVVPKIPKA